MMEERPPDLIPIERATEIIPVSARTLRRWIADRKWQVMGYRAWRISRTLFVRRSDCEEYMRSCRV
jgi:hypothetical protein